MAAEPITKQAYKMAIEALKEHVASVKHAKWECVRIDCDVRYDMVTMRCPICKRWHTGVYHYGYPTEFVNYCPYCGAKMEEEQ